MLTSTTSETRGWVGVLTVTALTGAPIGRRADGGAAGAFLTTPPWSGEAAALSLRLTREGATGVALGATAAAERWAAILGQPWRATMALASTNRTAPTVRNEPAVPNPAAYALAARTLKRSIGRKPPGLYGRPRG